jgi:hypothetical protein
MANQIGISPKQSIAALHARGASNRQIATLPNLHRDRVNWHVRLLKIQNRPVTPQAISREFRWQIQPSQSVSPGSV